MNERDTFESALTAAYARLADGASVAVDAAALTATVSATSPPAWRGARRRTVGVRPVAFVGIAALLAVGVAVVLVGAAGRRPEQRSSVLGAFSRTGELPPAFEGNRFINAAATLPDGRVLAIGMYDTGDPTQAWSSLYDPQAGTWTATGSEPFSRELTTATTLPDGRVLIVGGWRVDGEGNPVVPTDGELYNSGTGTFEPSRGSLVTPRYDHTATLLDDGRVLITGGSGADFNVERPELGSAETFDPHTGAFSPVGSMSVSRDAHVATRLADGRVLITGGITARDNAATNTAEIFDPATGAFAPTGSMAVARSRHAAVTLADGRVLVVGGAGTSVDPNVSEILASAELYDPRTGTFAPTGSLATERTQASAALLPDGRVLVAGGSNVDGAPRMAELFDPTTGRFEPAGASAEGHDGAWTDVLPDGRVLLLGRVQDPATEGAPELWSGSDTAIVLPPPPETSRPGFNVIIDATAAPRSGHTATRLTDGRVLLAGGVDATRPEAGAAASAEILDPGTGRSTAVGDMTHRRSGHAAVLLADGRVLLAGGEPWDCPPPTGDCILPRPSAEIFDPATGVFTRLPADLGPEADTNENAPTAVLLDDGKVLYAGTSNSTEGKDTVIIDPVTDTAEPTAPVPCSSRGSLVRLVDGRVLVQCSAGSLRASVYDATGRSVTAISDAESWDAAVRLADGRVLVVRTTGEAAIFDPATRAYTPTGSMVGQDDTSDRGDRGEYQRRLTLLADGRVLVSGGRSQGDFSVQALPNSDLYDPKTGTFEAIGPMHAPRFRHSATLLDDGRVLLVGGVSRSPDRTDPEPAVVEILDPRAWLRVR